mgnify:CR=1 FL=1
MWDLSEEERQILQQILANASPQEQSGLQASMEAIAALPPDQRAEAIKQLSMDYEGRGQTLRDDLETNYALLTQEGPQSDEGPAGNPYAVTIAAGPLEYAASAGQKYMAGKGIKQNKADLEKLSQGQEAGLGMTMEGMLAQARKLREEEEKKKLLRQYGGSIGGGGFRG